MHTTFMQGVAVNGEDGRHSSFQAPRLLPVSLFQLFSHIAQPPPPRHLHAAVEFSLPFFIFPFPPNFSHMVLQLICCVVFSVAPCWGLRRAALGRANWGYGKFSKQKNRIFHFLRSQCWINVKEKVNMVNCDWLECVQVFHGSGQRLLWATGSLLSSLGPLQQCIRGRRWRDRQVPLMILTQLFRVCTYKCMTSGFSVLSGGISTHVLNLKWCTKWYTEV